MAERFRGKNAVVTGASRGIGAAIADLAGETTRLDRQRVVRYESLDLLDELGRTVMTLDGASVYPGGYRVWRG